MKQIAYGISIFMAIMGIAMIISACATISAAIKIKPVPEYSGVDRRLKPYVNEYLDLSARHNITFKGYVTVGLKKIDEGNVIGLCTRGSGFHEVDIDKQFFKEEGELRRKILVFHELTHCYCERSHDFKGEEYPSALKLLINRFSVKARFTIPWCLAREVPGYLSDGCAATIMHPYILSKLCIEAHYDYYIEEMFNDCKPY